MKDGAAFVQFEGGRVFTEVLGNVPVERTQLLDEAFHIGQFGLGPLRCNKKRIQTAKAASRNTLTPRGRWEETSTIRKVFISRRKPG